MATRLREGIFDLIKSLTRSEKRYFKLYASRHASLENNVNIKLFEVIDAMSEYDEQLVFERLKGDACLNRFVITKKRLYDLILASLDAFHSSSSIDAQLFRMLHSADILRSKCLYDQSKKVLKSAFKLAVKYERKAICLEITHKMKALLETMESDSQEILQLGENEREIIRELKQVNEMNSVLWCGQVSEKTCKEQNGEVLFLDQDVSIRLLKNESAAHTALQNGQLEHAIVLTRHSLEVYEERGHLIWAKPLNYLSVLAEYAFLQLRLGQWEQAQFSLSKLETFQREIQCQDHPELCRFLELVHTRLTLEYSVRRGDLECNSEKSSRLLTLASAEFHSEHRAVIQVLVAGIFINMEELSKARRVLNKVMERGVKNRKNTNWRGCALVMQLIIDLETEPAHFVIQYIKSVRRQLMQSDQLNPIVKLFLSYAQKITKAAHLLQKQELWKELSDELLKSSQSNEQFDLVYFDLKCWALSKALNEKYSVVLSQKNQHGQVNSLRISA